MDAECPMSPTLTKNHIEERCAYYYHTSNSRECIEVNREALQLRAVYKSHIFFYCKSHENPYQVLQVIAIVTKALVCMK